MARTIAIGVQDFEKLILNELIKPSLLKNGGKVRFCFSREGSIDWGGKLK